MTTKQILKTRKRFTTSLTKLTDHQVQELRNEAPHESSFGNLAERVQIEVGFPVQRVVKKASFREEHWKPNGNDEVTFDIWFEAQDGAFYVWAYEGNFNGLSSVGRLRGE